MSSYREQGKLYVSLNCHICDGLIFKSIHFTVIWLYFNFFYLKHVCEIYCQDCLSSSNSRGSLHQQQCDNFCKIQQERDKQTGVVIYV